MSAKIASRVKCHLTLLPSVLIDMSAREWFLVQMNSYNMLLEGRMFPKRLVARRVLGTAIFVPTIMRGEMATKTGPSDETLPTARAITDIVTDSGMGALHVMLQMRST
jgi:hypothetical protein